MHVCVNNKMYVRGWVSVVWAHGGWVYEYVCRGQCACIGVNVGMSVIRYVRMSGCM